MQTWQTLSRQTLLQHSKFLTIEEHKIQLPDGQIISDWPWVITPDYVNVAAVTTNNKYLCFIQTKYSINGTSLAPVGGYIEPDEDPWEAAKRELLEETGHEAELWVSLGQYSVDGNRGAGTAHLFLARQAHKVKQINADDLEEQKLLYLSETEVEMALKENQFKVLPWVTVMSLALVYTQL